MKRREKKEEKKKERGEEKRKQTREEQVIPYKNHILDFYITFKRVCIYVLKYDLFRYNIQSEALIKVGGEGRINTAA